MINLKILLAGGWKGSTDSLVISSELSPLVYRPAMSITYTAGFY